MIFVHVVYEVINVCLLCMKKVEVHGCKYFGWNIDEAFDSSGVLSFLVKSKTTTKEMVLRLDAQVKELSTDLNNMIDANDKVMDHNKMLGEKVRMMESGNESADKKIRL